MFMLSRRLSLILTALLALPAWAEEKRQLDAHEHGHGSLNIAIEGNRIAMELIAPGSDVVGFEHEEKTKEQRVAIGKAKAALGEPLALFVLPTSAECRVTEAKVSLEAGAEDGHHEKDHANKEAHAHERETHSEFHGEYVLTCASPQALVGIDFKYFEMFPGAEELEVKLITDKGQSKFEVKRDKPHLDLKGIM